MKNYLAALIGLFFLSSQPAHAITVGGTQYDPFLQLSTPADKSAQGGGFERLGFWFKEKKFYTYNNGGPPEAMDIDGVLFADPEFAGFDYGSFFTMGTTAVNGFGPLASGNFSLTATNGANLLSGSYQSAGQISGSLITGAAGQLEISGLFTINSGQLFSSGLVGPTIYATFSYDRIVAFNSKDSHATLGTLTFFQEARGGGTEVPEPASAILIGSGLLAGFLKRKKVV